MAVTGLWTQLRWLILLIGMSVVGIVVHPFSLVSVERSVVSVLNVDTVVEDE